MIRRERLCLGPSGDAELPMIEVSAAIERDYALRAGMALHMDLPPDCGDLSSFIWFRDPHGRASAQRIARELKRNGFALIYPHDAVLVQPARVHHVMGIGCEVLPGVLPGDA